jgi:hypothetical protein
MMIHNEHPTRALRAAIKRESIQLRKRVAVLIIDEDGSLTRNPCDTRILEKEVMVLNAVRWLRPQVPIYLFQLALASKNEAGNTEYGDPLPTAPALRRAAGKRGVYRTKYAQSCFSTKGGLSMETELEGFDVLVIGGRYHDACVRETICDALAMGFKVLSAATIVAGGAGPNSDWKQDENLEWFC